MVGNLAVHVRLNHKKRKSIGFSGLSSKEKSVDRRETFKAGARQKIMWIRRGRSRLELTHHVIYAWT